MENSSESAAHHQNIHSTDLQTSPSLPSMHAILPNMQPECVLNCGPVYDSATESDSSRQTPSEPSRSRSSDAIAAPAPAAVPVKIEIEDVSNEPITNGVSGFQGNHPILSSSRKLLREIAGDNVDIVAKKLKVMPEELLEEVKSELRTILEGIAVLSPPHTQEFLFLRNLIQHRANLTPVMLVTAHHVQLEILCAIKMRIHAFLHPSVIIPRSRLTEIFFDERCRNISCQIALPAEDCSCVVCSSTHGFCNLCMCVLCSKFDFEVNSCRWIGCNVCSHWTHTDCAMHSGRIGTGRPLKDGISHPQTLLLCAACIKTSELLGWVKEIFKTCALSWDRDALLRELRYVCKIFQLSENSEERKLFIKCADLVRRLSAGTTESTSPQVVLEALQELDLIAPIISENENEELGHPITPHEMSDAANKTRQEAEAVGEETLRLKRPRLAVEAGNSELAENAREAAEKLEQEKAKEAERLELEEKAREAERLELEEKAREAERLELEKAREAERLELEEKTREAESLELELEAREAERLELEEKAREAERLELEEKAKEAERLELEEKAREAERLELEDKAREAERLELEEKAREEERVEVAKRLQKKQRQEELESIIQLKMAEAEMFLRKANEALQEAKRIQSEMARSEEDDEQEYTSLYLKHRLEEAEAEKQLLFDKIKRQKKNH